ncbi:MAG: hypothetical protein M1823_000074 [Watsoniomyces obsoletus]|nr:MAG: hypothetical protein M1823_000074 [Watsoniomyces obsoletus]
MAMSSPTHHPHHHAVPGSFISSDLSQSEHSILPPKLDVTVGPRSHIFQPPRSPSASSSLIQSSTSPVYQTPVFPVSGSRKRSRRDNSIDSPYCISASSSRMGWSIERQPSEASSFAASTVTSPAPMANTKYRLAGGRNRPSAATALKQESLRHATSEADNESGRTWSTTGTKRACMDDNDYDDYDYPSYSPVRTIHHGEHQQRLSPSSSQQHRDGWGRVVFNVVGEVAGRVWQFCRAGAFRGFYAGGGQGYAMPGFDEDDGNQNSDIRMQDVKMMNGDFVTPRTSPTRDEDDLGGSYMDLNSKEEVNTPPRPAKRIQREKGRGEPREQWIIVPSPEKTPRTSTPSSSNNGRRIRNTRASEVGIGGYRRSGGGRGVSSRPGGRRSGFSSGGLSSTPGANVNSPNRASHQQRPASYASPRGPPASPTKNDELQAVGLDSPETRRLMAKHQRIERAKEASMLEFNRRLKAMIQEGKEALGTTFTVEEVDMDADADATLDETDEEEDVLEDL